MRVSCPHPVACQAKEHVVGSAAATSCRLRGRSGSRTFAAPAPLTPAATATTAVYQDLEDAVLEELEASGWSPGTVHPTGGYDEVVLVRDTWVPARANLVYRRRGLDHREDGPASLSYFARDGSAELESSRWLVEGRRHREDGPAVEYPVPEWKDVGGGVMSRASKETDRFFLDDEAVKINDRDRETGLRAEALDKWGVKELTRWLAYEQQAGKKHTRALVRAGVSAKVALECAQAGVLERDAVLAVDRGDLPLSWASAGITS